MVFKGLGGIILLVLSSAAYSSDIQDVTIERLMVDADHGDKIFIKISAVPGVAPSCSTNGSWQYVMPLNTELEKGVMTSFLLSAHVAGKKIRLAGTDSCDVYPSIETLKRIEFLE